jgi:hypothetical protein
MTRECHVRFCERLGVRLPGATLPTGTRKVVHRSLNERIGDLSLVVNRNAASVQRCTTLIFGPLSQMGVAVLT